MTSRDRVLAALRSEKTDRVPWVPFVGCHAASLIGAKASDYLKSEALMIQGLEAAIARYMPDGIPVAFDLQLEAEAMGCELTWADENPPAVTTHPLALGVPLARILVPSADSPRIRATLNTARALRKAHPDLAMYGLVCGPFTLALHLLGTDIFMKMFDDPASVKQLMDTCMATCRAMSGYFVEAGCDIIAVVDPMTSQIGPEQFHEFVTPYVKPVFAAIRQKGALGSFFVCGHAQQNLAAMCDCVPDNISIDENIPLDAVRSLCVPRKISFGGNIQLTTVLLLGTPEDAQRNALACLEIGGDTGFVLAPGCDLPYATPPANIEAITKLVRDPYQRDILKATAATSSQKEVLDMRDYGQSDKIIVDVITLDSEACAPCQYMVEAVRKVTPEFEGVVEWREHKIKQRESLVFMTSLMVRNIPTICIDGQITFVSRIPARDELIAAIQKRIVEKARIKIKRRRSSLYILGDGGKECKELKARARKAVTELGADTDIVLITDTEKILSYGISPVMLPAVVVAKYQVKSTRTVPEVAIIKEWIKD
jgi:MtaA/CmuA family methyltransferase